MISSTTSKFLLLALVCSVSCEVCDYLRNEHCDCVVNTKEIALTCNSRGTTTGLTLTIKQNNTRSDILVQCGINDNRDKRYFDMLPNLNQSFFGRSSALRIIKCELPDNFSKITKKLPLIESVDFFLGQNENFFNEESSIINLDVSLRFMTNISGTLLQNLKHLEVINLRGIQSDTLPSKIFQHNVKLKQIVLKINGLTLLPLDIFHNLRHLEMINLKANKLKELHR